MRLSKTQRSEMRLHCGNKPSPTYLKELREFRRELFSNSYTIIHDDTKRPNPKHNRSARRERPIPHPSAVRIPYCFKYPKKFESHCQFPKGRTRGHFSQLVANMDLMGRARFLIQNGYYPLIVQPEVVT